MKLPHKLVSGCLRTVNVYYFEGDAAATLTSHRKHPERTSGSMGKNLIKLGLFLTRRLKDDGLIQPETSLGPGADKCSVEKHKKETNMGCGI